MPALKECLPTILLTLETCGAKSLTTVGACRIARCSSPTYSPLGSQISHRKTKRQVTAAFAGGALAFLLLGAAMSLRWFGRLI